jgi:hypothetical protein
MVQIPWPVQTNPGLEPQEGTGRLINVYPEPRGDGTVVYHRAPGATVFARNPSSGTIGMEIEVLGRSETLMSTFFQLVGSSTTQVATSGNNTHTFPNDAVSGDLLFVAYAADSTGGARPTTPTDWTELWASTLADVMGASLMYKVSTGEQNVELNIPDVPSVLLSFSIRGAMSTAPIVESATRNDAAGGTDPIPADITNTTADSLLVNVAWMDDDIATAVFPPSTITIAGTTAFGMGGEIFAASTGVSNSDACSICVAFRPLATTGAITGSTWAVSGVVDNWLSLSFTLRHD